MKTCPTCRGAGMVPTWRDQPRTKAEALLVAADRKAPRVRGYPIASNYLTVIEYLRKPEFALTWQDMADWFHARGFGFSLGALTAAYYRHRERVKP